MAATKAKAASKRKTAAKKPAAKKTTKRTSVARKTAKAKAKSKPKAAKSNLGLVDLGKAEDVAKNVWYAGLGAYGKSFDELKSNYDKVNEQSQKLFDELVKRGETVQNDAESALKERRETVEDRITDARKSVDDMVDKIDLSGRVKQIFSRIEDLGEDLRKAV